MRSCNKITYAFKVLHSIGYSYQDINDGNFFIDVNTGDVLIGDNDNVAPNGWHTGIIGKPRYMAPEIVVGNGRVMPDVWTDRYSLGVILFLLIFTSHPLEGKRWLTPCLTDAYARRLYGEDPVFVCDAEDKSNRPDPNIHVNMRNRWPYMPGYVKDAFRNAFSKDALHEPQRRMTEGDWLEVLTRFLNDSIICPYCKNNILISNIGDSVVCDGCGKNVEILHMIQLPKYVLAGVDGTKIYRCQLGFCSLDSALEEVAVIEHVGGKPYLKNRTANTWAAVTMSGKVNQVAPGEFIPLRPGIEFKAFDKPIKIIK